MDLNDLKLEYLEIDPNIYKNIYSFVDFGNVNYWYEEDIHDSDNNILPDNQKQVVGIEKLGDFVKLFSNHTRFYFGIDEDNSKSIRIISLSRKFFNVTCSKPIQWIKHRLKFAEESITTRDIKQDKNGKYILIPKCNFDVEISIDAIKLLDKYDTFCLFSSDADFTSLLDFLKKKGKKIILFSAGYVTKKLKDKADLNINAQKIKNYITFIKEKPRLK